MGKSKTNMAESNKSKLTNDTKFQFKSHNNIKDSKIKDTNISYSLNDNIYNILSDDSNKLNLKEMGNHISKLSNELNGMTSGINSIANQSNNQNINGNGEIHLNIASDSQSDDNL